jgi:hypothetical protein
MEKKYFCFAGTLLFTFIVQASAPQVPNSGLPVGSALAPKAGDQKDASPETEYQRLKSLIATLNSAAAPAVESGAAAACNSNADQDKGLEEFGGLTRSQMVKITSEVEKRAPKPANYFEKSPTREVLDEIEKKRSKEIDKLLDAHALSPKTKSKTVKAIIGVMLSSDVADYDLLNSDYRGGFGF